ncbi:MAG: thioredoxin domain-containing protein [Candidatus Zambryskibacteria bacterium]|nr:thioredoxin domain-containing protein [Candidatus Zambryskibacteria bacterium]
METESNKFLVPLAIVVAGALVSGAIYFGDSTPSTSSGRTTDNANTDIDIAPVSNKDHIRGASSARFFVIEYSDTECPFCKTFHGTMKEVLRTYGNDVAWVYRHFPIEQLHAKAIKESEATECAAEQGGNQAFWTYTDKVFERTNSNDSLPESELPKIAADIGLNVGQFNSCLSSGKYAEAVKKSVEAAVKAGARGTPYSVIVDQEGEVKNIINGAEPLANVKAKLDALLK